MRPFRLNLDDGATLVLRENGVMFLTSTSATLTASDVRKLKHQFEVVASDASLED